jgi:hypothetical protein
MNLVSKPTTKQMQDAGRARARAPSRPWTRLTAKDLPGLYEDAIRVVVLGLPFEDTVTVPTLLDMLASTFTWEGYFVPHIRAGKDPVVAMQKDLRETIAAALAHANA